MRHEETRLPVEVIAHASGEEPMAWKSPDDRTVAVVLASLLLWWDRAAREEAIRQDQARRVVYDLD